MARFHVCARVTSSKFAHGDSFIITTVTKPSAARSAGHAAPTTVEVDASVAARACPSSLPTRTAFAVGASRVAGASAVDGDADHRPGAVGDLWERPRPARGSGRCRIGALREREDVESGRGTLFRGGFCCVMFC